MIITIICDIPLRNNNGTAIAAVNLINHLKEKGHEVRIVCPDKDKLGLEGYYVVPTYNLLFLNSYVEKNGVVLAKPKKNIIKEAINGSDVVHLLMPLMLSKKAAKIAKEMNIPITASFHCQAENVTNHFFLMNSKKSNDKTYMNFYNKVYSYCDVIHYPTKFIQDIFEKSINKKTNGLVISNGVNKIFTEASKNPLDDGIFRILTIGRYSKEKSQSTLIEAIKKSKYKDKIELTFAGDGPLKDKLIELSNELLIKPHFEFYSRTDLIKVIEKSNLYVHTAEIEIEAISCLEAICGGLVPIIANSNRSATKAFALDENNLFMVNDSSELAAKIDYFYENPKVLKEYEDKYHDFKLKFDQQECMNQMEDMFLNIVKK